MDRVENTVENEGNAGHHTIPAFYDLRKRSPLKTLWQKENMLVTSICYFSQNVFSPSQKNFQFFNHIYFVICKWLKF